MPDIPNRDNIEARLARVLGKALGSDLKRLMELLGDPPRLDNVPPKFWDEMDKDLRSVLVPVLQEIFTGQAEVLTQTLTIGVDWGLVNQHAIDWASQYSFDLVRGITDVTMRGLQNAISTYYRDGLTLGSLEKIISGYFGPVRAEMIAVTEVTRASVEGEQTVIQQIEKDNGSIRMVGAWNTSNDERVCVICRPLNQRKEQGRDEHNRPFFRHPESGIKYPPPPVHPRDRCWVNYTMTLITP